MSTSDPTRIEPLDGASPVEAVEAVLDQPFDAASLIALRAAVAAHAGELGLSPVRCDELTLVAHELASNVITHGGGHGRLRLWTDDGHVRCEVSDTGPGLPAGITAGRQRPPLGATGGRGLWLARTLTDDLVLATGPAGTTVTVTVTVNNHVDSGGER
jgi:anti-sigma regulatory factor (Ser/Thr protein kinase)